MHACLFALNLRGKRLLGYVLLSFTVADRDTRDDQKAKLRASMRAEQSRAAQARELGLHTDIYLYTYIDKESPSG